MTEQFMGEMQIFAFPFAPKGWSMANGSLLSVQQSQALFSLYGTTFGGDGIQNFAIPDTRMRFVCGTRPARTETTSARVLGEVIGTKAVALTADQNPLHGHQIPDYRPTAVKQRVPGPAEALGFGYGDGLLAFGIPGNTAMAGAALLSSGSGEPHENLQPFLALNYCVALTGIYPSSAT